MDYVKELCLMMQIIEYFDSCMIDEFSEIKPHNIAIYFFKELEKHKTTLDTLLELQKDYNIDLGTRNNLKKTYESYLEIKKIVGSEIKKYRYEILSINLDDYFVNSKVMDEFAEINLEKLLDRSLEQIKEYKNIEIYDYEYEVTIDETTSLIENFFSNIDKSGNLTTLFKQTLNNKNVYIWSDESKRKQELLENKILIENYASYGLYNSFVSRVNDELYMNVYCEEIIADCYSIIHEFIHYIMASKQISNKESLSFLFFSEFPSIFFEYLFRLYLEENDIYPIDRDIQIEDRKIETIKNLFFASAFYRLQKENEVSDKIDFNKIYQQYIKTEEFNVFEAEALAKYDFLEEYIYDPEKFCDYLNEMLSDYDCCNVMIYITAVMFSENLIAKIKDGKIYLIDRVLSMMNSLVYNDMDPIYFIDYLELDYGFYYYKPASENVIPKRLEKLKQ